MRCPYCRSDVPAGASRCPACTTWIADPPQVREWFRAREGKLLGGVAAGLSRRFGLPVAAIRLVFLLSVLLGGWGVVVYVALWIAMPREHAWEVDRLAARAARAPVAPPPQPPPPASRA